MPFRRLLAVIEASSAIRAGYPRGGAVWAAFVRVQQLATAALWAIREGITGALARSGAVYKYDVSIPLRLGLGLGIGLGLGLESGLGFP